MQKTKRLSEGQSPGGALELARVRLGKAQSSLATTKERARLAKRRRKEAKVAARKARKELKSAKRELRQAEIAVAEAESRLMQAAKPQVKKPTARLRAAKPKPRAVIAPIRRKQISKPPASPLSVSVTPAEEGTAADLAAGQAFSPAEGATNMSGLD